jgi:hypothetical protein
MRLTPTKLLATPADEIARAALDILKDPKTTRGGQHADVMVVLAALLELPEVMPGHPTTPNAFTHHKERAHVEEALAILIWRGLAMLYAPHNLQGLPSLYYRLTPLGREVPSEEFDVATLGARAFVAKIPEFSKWDEVVQFYYEHALDVNEKQAHAASQFLLGAAAETALLRLGDALVGKVSTTEQENRFNRARGIKEKTEVLVQVVAAMEKKNPDEAWLGDLDSSLNGLAGIYRRGRNEIGHPKRVPTVDVRVLRAHLASFPSLMDGVMKAIKFTS